GESGRALLRRGDARRDQVFHGGVSGRRRRARVRQLSQRPSGLAAARLRARRRDGRRRDPDPARASIRRRSNMTPRQIELVRVSWSQVLPVAEQAAASFYGRLFTLDPSLASLFKSDLRAQGRKLTSMINTVVANLSNLSTLVPAIED